MLTCLSAAFMPLAAAYVALWWWLDGTPLWTVVVVVVTMPALFILGLRMRARERAIYRHGLVALGRVVRSYKRAPEAQRSSMVVIVQFMVNGVVHEGGFTVHGLPPPPVGTPYWVLHDPAGPVRNVILR